jgi:hypothetical protein
MADKTNLVGQKLTAALLQFMEVGLRLRYNRREETQTKTKKLVHIGLYFIPLMLLLPFLMMCRPRG